MSNNTTPTTIKTRRSHTKSRGGCLECKRRRLKCNEARPTCLGCWRRGMQEACLYPTTGQDPRPSEDERVKDSSRSSVKGSLRTDQHPETHQVHESRIALPKLSEVAKHQVHSGHQLKTYGIFDMEDMGLWYHFTNQTVYTLAPHWAKLIVPLALSNDYLMHGLLSLAAHHLAYLHPDEKSKYYFLLNEHQGLGIPPFRKAMSAVTDENCPVLFSFAAALTTNSFAYPALQEAPFSFPGACSYKGLANWVTFLRGCASIFDLAHNSMTNSEFWIFSPSRYSTPEKFREDNRDDQNLVSASSHLLGLKIVRSTTTVEEMDAYAKAIQDLRTMFTYSLEVSDVIYLRAVALSWPVKLTPTFMRLLDEERPPALIIMTWYCVLLKMCEGCWYIRSRGREIFRAVQRMLAPEWSPCIAWPRDVFDQAYQ